MASVRVLPAATPPRPDTLSIAVKYRRHPGWGVGTPGQPFTRLGWAHVGSDESDCGTARQGQDWYAVTICEVR